MNSINELPENVAAGDPGHVATHEVVHAGLKDHETRISSVEADVSGKADLVDGKVPVSQVPDLAITDFLGEVASAEAMNALNGQKGDWAVRTDRGSQWILVDDGEWREMVSPASPVQSVAGKTGSVTLAKADVGLANVDNTSDANKPISTAVNSALAGKANSTHTHSISDVTGLQAGLDAKSGTDHKHAAADITSGTFAIARIPTGTTASTVALGNDARFTDTRTPKAHNHAITDVTGLEDALQGKANSSHTHTIDEVTGLQAGLDGKSGTDHKHAAADITSGTFAIERIPTGTTASTVAVGNDPRLSDARTPKTHDHEISGVNGLEDALDAKADLVDGKVPAEQLPDSVGQIASMQSTISSLESRIADLEAAAAPE